MGIFDRRFGAERDWLRRRKGAPRVSSVVVALAMIVACSTFDVEFARRDFSRDHPSWTIERVGVGEGDGSAVYVHVVARKPNSTRELEFVYQYINVEGVGWRLGHVESPPGYR